MTRHRSMAVLMRMALVFSFVLAAFPGVTPAQTALAAGNDATAKAGVVSKTATTPAAARAKTLQNAVELRKHVGELVAAQKPQLLQQVDGISQAVAVTPTSAAAATSLYLPAVVSNANPAAAAVDNSSASVRPLYLPFVSLNGAAPVQGQTPDPGGSNPVGVGPAATTLHLRVESARAWDPSGLVLHQAIPHYHWLVTEDDTGDPSHYGTNLGPTDIGNSNYACSPPSVGGDPDYPAHCQWPAIHSVRGGTSAEVVAQGDETTLNESTGIDVSTWTANDHNPRHSYLISVMADGFDIPGCTASATVTCHVDGFKIDGQWFTTPLNQPGADPGLVTVDMQPYPLPLLTVRMAVWNDLQTNGAYDTGEPFLAGFQGHISDVLGEVTTDWYGNPLCTTYQHDANGLMLFDADGKPQILQLGGRCLSDANGIITIPYLGPDRYSSTVSAPDGQEWFQTSTLEGWHDWDTWAIEGWDGYDPEFVQGAEPFPFAEFGFVQIQGKPGTTDTPATATDTSHGSVHGLVIGTGEFAPGATGFVLGNVPGQRVIGPIDRPLLSLVDNNNNDSTVYVGRGNADGTFQINNIPDGDYSLTVWDEDQAYIIETVTFTIQNGESLDVGNVDLAAWWSRVHGKVCFDANRNGKCDPGETGIAGLTLNLLGRDNSLQFYGDNTAVTDANGNYDFPRTYPLGQWVVAQGYWEQFYTVGVTYQTNNQPSETTVMANGGFVDVSTYNNIGQDSRLDWAVHPYETNPALGPVTGGIVGEVVATTTRNELDARYQAIEAYEPGLPGVQVHLYAPVACDPAVAPPAGDDCTEAATAFGTAYYLTSQADGAFLKLSDAGGNPIDLAEPYTSETWQRPQDCVARGPDMVPVVEQVLPPSTGGHDCLEAPMMANQLGNNSVGDFMQVNGNYGFTEIDHDPTTGAALAAPIAVPPGDYLVEAVPPNAPAMGKPIWEPVKEEDVNIFSGDEFVAPGETPLNPPLPNRTAPAQVVTAIPPFPCAGPLHTVNVVDVPTAANFDPANPSTTQGVYNPDFAAGGGSPYEGQKKPLCSTQLVTVRNGRSATPNFHFKTHAVPLPGRILGLMVDDLNLSINPKELFYGEKAGMAGIPIGIYDFANRLVKTIYTDPQGEFEVTLPSTSSYNCPLPAGPCPGVYRFLGNDPGQPGHQNPGYNPAYRTIGAFFEVWPGVTLPADLAPVPVAFGIEQPGTQNVHYAACLLNDPAQPSAPKIPELFAVSKPYARSSDNATNRTITLNGDSFGAAQGQVMLDTTALPVSSWNNQQIVVTVPANFGVGPHQLSVTAANGQKTVNGLTFHMLGGSYNPTVIEVGPGKAFSPTDPNPLLAAHAVQRALDQAANSNSNKLVVIYPNTPSLFNPFGSYFENVIIHSPVKLQGVGPGGLRADNSQVIGSVLDGLGYGTDGERDTAWQATLNALPAIVGANNTAADPQAVPEGAVVLAVATRANQYGNSYKAAIDGFMIQNGDVLDFVPNMNSLGNGAQVGNEPNTPTNPNQGGGIVAYAATRFLQITNNILRSNTGAYGGAIRVGTPLVGDNHVDGAHIAYNRILNNGGANLAGAVGIFTGAYGYEVNNNDLCGNFSAEYGGGISHFGLTGRLLTNGNRPNNSSGSPSSIHDNRIYFNGSYDEGAGIMIAGEPPATLTTLSPGAGPVNIYSNLIEANLANDDGGGLRFLTAGNFPYNVYNNIIVNNISTHEGGGVAIDNAPNVRFFNNTVMRNITTATAATSTGEPAPAGLSSSLNNVYLQATLPAGSPLYSNPLMFNNIFWDNRAGHWSGGNIVGIGAPVWSGGVQIPDPTPINNWDMGVPDTGNLLSPTNSVLQPTANPGVASSPTNVLSDPLVKQVYDATVTGLPWRGNPNFINSVIVAQDLPVTIMGDYHIAGTNSPAYNLGAASKAAPGYQQPPGSLAAPTDDIDHDGRPALGGFDSGADEFPGLHADLSISKTDGQTSVAPGAAVNYTIVVANAGPDAVAGAVVTDNFPALLTVGSWTCTATGGSSCTAAGSGNNRTGTVTLLAGGSATFSANTTLAAGLLGGSLANTATVATPAGTTDANTGNNAATDTDVIAVPLPALGVLDNFNRANANTLGGNWSQITLLGSAAIRVNANQALAQLGGWAVWNVPVGGFGARQGAAFTFASAPGSGLLPPSLFLKATGGTATVAANYIQVSYDGSQITVATTTNSGGTMTTRATFPATFASGDTLSAVAYADGTVNIYQTSGATTSELGSVTIPVSGAGAWTQGTGGGRIGFQLPTGARADNFAGGTVP